MTTSTGLLLLYLLYEVDEVVDIEFIYLLLSLGLVLDLLESGKCI